MTETDIKALIRSLVTPLLRHPESLSITVSDSDRFRRYTVNVDAADVGRLIGRQGHVVEGARSRRTNAKKIRLLINDHRH